MTKSYRQLIDSNQTYYLLEHHPFAYLLLTLIALRARRMPNHPDGLEPGEAWIGDFEKCGLTRQQYRTSLKTLTNLNYIKIIWNGKNKIEREISTITSTNKGTLVKLINTEIYDINIMVDNQVVNQHPTNCQPTANHKQERIRKNKNEKEKKQEYLCSESAPPLQTEITYDDSNKKFINITPSDIDRWSKAYPSVNIEQELARAADWIVGNPTRKKKNWEKFLGNWFRNSDDRKYNLKASKAFKSNEVDRSYLNGEKIVEYNNLW